MTARISATRQARSPSDAGSRRPDALVVFPSSLGWMGIVGSGRTLKGLTFGHRSATAALAAVRLGLARNARPRTWNEPLVRRLQEYASGARDDFRDIEADPGPLTDFRQRVLACCRRVPYGETLTYGELAAQVGSAGAARAVGNCMASNPIPLVIPCHRVIASDGGIGGYSAVGGARMKRRLLALEAGQRPA